MAKAGLPPDQIKVLKKFAYSTDGFTKWNYELVSERAYVSNQYSFIPLHLMLKLAMEKNLKFEELTIKNYEFTPNIFPDNISFLQDIQKSIENYTDKVIANPTTDHHYHIAEDDLKKLRNRYLHYNARLEGGLIEVNKPEEDRIRDIVKPSK